MKKVILFFLLLALAGGGFYWWRTAHRPPSVRVLESAEIRRGTVRKVLEETGIVKSQVGAIVKIGARATGTIEQMLVKVGDRVARGQLVARLDSRELRAQQAEARAQLAVAQAELARVERVLPLQIAEAQANLAEAQAQGAYVVSNSRRLAQLLAGGYVSRDEAQNARQKARAQQNLIAARRATLKRLQGEYAEQRRKARLSVQQNEAALQAIAVRLSYTRIHSPLDGVVSQVTAQEGETIVAGLQVANLITVLDPRRLEMWVYVDETDVGQVRAEQKVEFRVDAYPERTFAGRVATIYPEPELRDNIVYYRALVEVSSAQAELLRPEMTTQVQIVVAEKPDVLLLPNTALKWVDDHQLVFVVTPEGKVRRVTPKLGLAGLTHTEVLAGLNAGERVATQLVLPAGGQRQERP